MEYIYRDKGEPQLFALVVPTACFTSPYLKSGNGFKSQFSKNYQVGLQGNKQIKSQDWILAPR